MEYDFSGTIEQALRWHPAARTLLVVTGSSERDRGWEARLRREVPQVAGGCPRRVPRRTSDRKGAGAPRRARSGHRGVHAGLLRGRRRSPLQPARRRRAHRRRRHRSCLRALRHLHRHRRRRRPHAQIRGHGTAGRPVDQRALCRCGARVAAPPADHADGAAGRLAADPPLGHRRAGTSPPTRSFSSGSRRSGRPTGTSRSPPPRSC